MGGLRQTGDRPFLMAQGRPAGRHLDEKEDEYNARVAPLIGAALLDERFSRLRRRRAASNGAICSWKNGDSVHVKRKTRSSTLSHLFSQGLVAGRVLSARPEIPFGIATRRCDGCPSARECTADRDQAAGCKGLRCDLRGDLPCEGRHRQGASIFSQVNLCA